MSDRRDASRLARALIDVVAREKADGQAIERELRDFDRLVERHAPLAAVLTNPAVPVTRKHALVEQLLSRTVEISTITRAFLLFLAERDRLALLSDLVEAYRDRLLEHLKVVRAEVTTATPLAGDRKHAIAESLERAVGRRVEMETRVDPSIIGGVIAQIGSVVYDGSVARQLSRLKEQLVTGPR